MQFVAIRRERSRGCPDGREATQPLDIGPLGPSNEMHDNRTETTAVDAEAPQAVDIRAQEPALAEKATPRHSQGWKLKVSTLALAGAAMVGGVFALEGDVPGPPKEPHLIAAANGPTQVQRPSDETVAASSSAGAPLTQSSAQSTPVIVDNSERQPVDLTAQPSPPKASSSAASASAVATQPAADVSSGTTAAATISTPAVAAAAAPPPQVPDPNPVRTVPLRPDEKPIAPPASSAADSTGTSSGVDASPPSAKPAPEATNGAARTAQPSTPRLDLPTKHPGEFQLGPWSPIPARPTRPIWRRRASGTRFGGTPSARRR